MITAIWDFLKHPLYVQDPNTNFRYRAGVFINLLALALIISMVLGMIISLIVTIGDIELGDHAVDQFLDSYSPYLVLLAGIVLAPLLEESIFRAPLFLFRNSPLFPWAFYTLSIIFGLYHITNFELSPSVLIAMPLLVSPQLAAGLLFGFIRVRFGFLWAVALHAAYNAVLLGPVLLIKIFRPELI